jgi:hypothetical protein
MDTRSSRNSTPRQAAQAISSREADGLSRHINHLINQGLRNRATQPPFDICRHYQRIAYVHLYNHYSGEVNPHGGVHSDEEYSWGFISSPSHVHGANTDTDGSSTWSQSTVTDEDDRGDLTLFRSEEVSDQDRGIDVGSITTGASEEDVDGDGAGNGRLGAVLDGIRVLFWRILGQVSWLLLR